MRTRSYGTAPYGESRVAPAIFARYRDEDTACVTVYTLLRRLADWRIQSTRCDWLDVSAEGEGLASTGGAYFQSTARHEFGLRRLETSFGAASPSLPRRLPFRDRTCDVLSVTGVLSRLDAAARCHVLCEVRRILRPDGVLAVFEENPFHPRRRLLQRRPDEGRPLHPSAMQDCLANAGFEYGSRWYYSFKPAFFGHLGSAWERRLMHWPLGRRYAVCGINQSSSSAS